MIDVNLTFNGFNFSPYLSTYKVTHEVEVSDSVTTMDGTEHFATRKRPTITFKLIPVSDATAASMYSALSAIIGEATYTDPYLGNATIASMRVTSKIEQTFGLRSIDGNRYYKGGAITLRQRTVL